MLIVMDHFATNDQIQAVVEAVQDMGCTARPIPGGDRVAIGVLYNTKYIDEGQFLSLSGVKDVIRVTRPYKLVSREFKPDDTVLEIKGAKIGGEENFAVIAGPCSVESEEQVIETARAVKDAGALLLRGGAFKPRTSPYAFQGMGEEGLKILKKASEETGLGIVTEAIDHEIFDMVEEYADVVQIGARNMQNFSLLRRAGLSKKPVLLKRGISSTLEEWLMAAEYIMEGGNTKVILCERGIRTFATHHRNTLDISSVTAVKSESHLPVIVDPSHAAGRRDMVEPLGLAAVAAGAHGLMVEVHYKPDTAKSDGAQSLYTNQFKDMMRKVNKIREVLK